MAAWLLIGAAYVLLAWGVTRLFSINGRDD